jgi:hypothetical protein
MKKLTAFCLVFIFFTASCSGVNSVVKKRWKNSENTIAIMDMTSNGDELMNAGAQLHRALEESLLKTNFVVGSSDESTHYKLKYKVIEFDHGSRVKRFATLGVLSKSGQANVKVKAALFTKDKLVGRWDVESWLNDGFLGGSSNAIFNKAAEEIVDHLKGDY